MGFISDETAHLISKSHPQVARCFLGKSSTQSILAFGNLLETEGLSLPMWDIFWRFVFKLIWLFSLWTRGERNAILRSICELDGYAILAYDLLKTKFKAELCKKIITTLPEAEGACDESYLPLKVALTAIIYAMAANNGLTSTTMLSEPLPTYADVLKTPPKTRQTPMSSVKPRTTHDLATPTPSQRKVAGQARFYHEVAYEQPKNQQNGTC